LDENLDEDPPYPPKTRPPLSPTTPYDPQMRSSKRIEWRWNESFLPTLQGSM